MSSAKLTGASIFSSEKRRRRCDHCRRADHTVNSRRALSPAPDPQQAAGTRQILSLSLVFLKIHVSAGPPSSPAPSGTEDALASAFPGGGGVYPVSPAPPSLPPASARPPGQSPLPPAPCPQPSVPRGGPDTADGDFVLFLCLPPPSLPSEKAMKPVFTREGGRNLSFAHLILSSCPASGLLCLGWARRFA